MKYKLTSNKELIRLMSSACISNNKILSYDLNECVCELERPQFNLVKNEALLIGMERIGKGGEIIKVFKLRTMYSGSRHLQSYLMETNGLVNGDKIANDFRHTRYAKILRATFLDELPMIINLFRGDIKFIGLRVISDKKMAMLTKKLQLHRKNFRPALIPVYYCFSEINSLKVYEKIELDYIESYKNHPFSTDLKYFALFLGNIFKKPLKRLVKWLKVAFSTKNGRHFKNIN